MNKLYIYFNATGKHRKETVKTCDKTSAHVFSWEYGTSTNSRCCFHALTETM